MGDDNKQYRDSVILFDGLDLGAGSDEIIGETQVALQQVGFDAFGRLNGHLGAILENRHGELVAGQTCQPQTEVSVHLK